LFSSFVKFVSSPFNLKKKTLKREMSIFDKFTAFELLQNVKTFPERFFFAT